MTTTKRIDDDDVVIDAQIPFLKIGHSTTAPVVPSYFKVGSVQRTHDDLDRENRQE